MSWKKYKRYYVYTYLNSDNTPFYIGMGQNDRIQAKHLYVTFPGYNNVHVIDNLTKQEAWDLETELVEQYGLKCNGTGILENLRAGGKTSNSDWYHSEQAKQKISEGNNGKVRTEEHKKNYRKPKTKEHAENIRQANLGRKPDGRYEKISKTTKGRPWSQARRDAHNKKKLLKEQNNELA